MKDIGVAMLTMTTVILNILIILIVIRLIGVEHQMQGIEVKVIKLEVDIAITAHCYVGRARWYNQVISLISFVFDLVCFIHKHRAYHDNSFYLQSVTRIEKLNDHFIVGNN